MDKITYNRCSVELHWKEDLFNSRITPLKHFKIRLNSENFTKICGLPNKNNNFS